MNNLYIIQCAHCGEELRTKKPCHGKIVICPWCSRMNHLSYFDIASFLPDFTNDQVAGTKGSDAGIAFRNQMDKLFIRIEDDKMLDKILKQAIKEDNIKMWYQKIADYIKKYINIPRL